ncbi:MAG: prepilin-type N-terminal cleavage/methylation domain-containing protein [Pirellulaceae bacterium]|nr:prepilin-type N-terminal cleavage/methylation domain-containing protein [Pirellulaceae bacterium]
MHAKVQSPYSWVTSAGCDRPKPSPGKPQIRCGFSLLEVLIAMLLGAFLMLAIFETFFVTARYRILAGESQASGISLSNAIRDLTSDLLAQPSGKIPDRPTQSIESTELPMPSKLLQPRLSFRDSFALESRLEWTQFTGRTNYVALRTRAWNSRFSQLPPNVSPSGESLVVWWLYQGSKPRIEGWRNKDLSTAKTLKLPPNPRGLIRTQFFIDRTGAEHEHSEVIMPEAVALELRYYNGNELQNEWDVADEIPTNQQRTPSAIEVRLKVENEVIEHWISIPRE